MTGKFVTLEGPEGGGKSTACRRITEAFSDNDILVVREPGSTSMGEKIRSILQTEDMPDRAELMLFEAARACIVDSVIRPALARGINVICDRFYDSTTAYQGYGRGLSFVDIDFLNSMATGGLVPDLTLVFDVDPAIGLARNRQNGKKTDRIETAGDDFHGRVRDGFVELAKSSPRFRLLDASRGAEEVFADIVVELESRFGWKRLAKQGA